jgi:hypothetical protein
MSTLSAVGAGVLISVYQEELIDSSLLAGGLGLLLTSAFVSLVGLLVPMRGFFGSSRGRDVSSLLSLAVLWFSIYTFATGVLTITTRAMLLPPVLWIVLFVAATIFFAILFVVVVISGLGPGLYRASENSSSKHSSE